MPASWSSRAIRSWQRSGNRPGIGQLPGLFTAEKLDAFIQQLASQTFTAAAEDSAAALKKATQTEIRRVISEQKGRSGGIAPLLRVTIDGVTDDGIASIKPDSRIVLSWNYLPEASIRTYEALVERSPKSSGKYIAGLLSFIDGEPEGFSAITYDTQEVRIVASVDYARRLEVGKDAHGEPWVKLVAPHIVEETAIVAGRLFGKDLAKLQYTYVDLTGAWELSEAGRIPRHFENGRWRYGHSPRTRGGRLETHVRYPAIIITPVD